MRNIIITGAAGGIGTATVAELLQTANYRLVCIDANPAALRDLEVAFQTAVDSGRLVPIHSVLDSFAECQSVARSVKGGIGGLVHLAGKNATDSDSYDNIDTWTEVINSNLQSAYFLAGAVMECLPVSGQPNMVFTSSIAYRRGSYDSLIYTIAKAGIVGLTRTMAKRLGKHGGVVNAIAPGVIETSMSAEYIKNNAANLERQIPIRRVGQPSDVAKLIRFLVSEECTYVTGQTINIDGGLINS